MAGASYHQANSLEEALQRAAQHQGEYVYFAGGTDIQVYRKQQLNTAPHIIDLSRIPALQRLSKDDDTLTIGAGVTLDELLQNSLVTEHYPLLAAAAQVVASPVIRMTATVGDNLLVNNRCTYYNQSAFWRAAAGGCLRTGTDVCLAAPGQTTCYARNVSDLAPALIVMRAEVTVTHQNGSQRLPLVELYNPDGIRHYREIGPDAVLTAIHLPAPPARWWYRKLRRRRSIEFSSLTVAGAADSAGRLRICVNAACPAPVLLEGSVAEADPDTWRREARRRCRTIDNDLLPLKYRRDMLDLFVTDCLNALTRKGE